MEDRIKDFELKYTIISDDCWDKFDMPATPVDKAKIVTLIMLVYFCSQNDYMNQISLSIIESTR